MAVDALAAMGANLWFAFLQGLPKLIVAVILLIVGFVVGKAVGLVVKEILVRVGVDKYLKKEEHLKFKASSVFDVIARWLIYFMFIWAAVDVLNIGALSMVMQEIMFFLPGLVGAIIIIIVIYALALYVKEEIIASHNIYADMVGKVIFFLLMYIGIAIALPLIRIDPTLINNLLLVVIGSIGVGMAIALGLGLKDVVRDMAKGYAKDFVKKRARKRRR